MNFLYPPAKSIDYEALEESKKDLSEIKAREAAQKKRLEPYKQKEKADYDRFLRGKEPKRLVFYSEGSGFYKYFEKVIDELLRRSNVVIHYITSDPNDQIFEIAKVILGDQGPGNAGSARCQQLLFETADRHDSAP